MNQTMNALIKWHEPYQRYEAFDENGKLLAIGPYHNNAAYHNAFSLQLASRGVNTVTSHSRLGRIILDKINQHSI